MNATDDEEDRDRLFMRGQKAAYLEIMSSALRELSSEDDDLDDVEKMAVRVARLERERAVAIAQLRMLCDRHGDNEWHDTDYLPDTIEKHLRKHLEAPDGDNE